MIALDERQPLAALEVLVLDTETTGLDLRHARIIQIAAVRGKGGTIEAEPAIDALIDPGVPIPSQSTAIHGIADADVRGKPPFPANAQPLAEVMAGRVVVGHSIGFDLAALEREHALAGVPWSEPPSLDVRALARIAAPERGDLSLDDLCAWLGVVIEGRHTARGDTFATAEVWTRLLPLLRAKGVRTLAEAKAAVARQADERARAQGNLSASRQPAPVASDRPPLVIDSYAYRHRVADVMSTPPHFIDGAETVAAAMRLLLEKSISSVFVGEAGGAIGIATERDLLRAIANDGADALDQPVEAFTSGPLQGLAEDEFVYRAIGRMQRLGIRHLAVWSAEGEVVGALTPRNLLRDRAMQAIVIGDALATASDAGDLAAAWGEAAGMAGALRREGTAAHEVADVISAEIRTMTARAAEMAEAHMQREGRGAPPRPYAVLVLGSAGRGESLLAADQDNAIVYAGNDEAATDQWFAAFARHMNDILDAAGIALCKGGVMACNAPWRHTVDGWHALIATWLARQSPDDLLNVDIFFDARPVHGDLKLGRDLVTHAWEQAANNPTFLMMLTRLAGRWRSPLNWLGSFKQVDGRVDLKKGGLLPIFTAARVLALRHRVLASSTRQRLSGLMALGKGSANDFDSVIEAHELLLAAVLDQQVRDAGHGVSLSPRVAMAELSAPEKRRLRGAIGGVETAIALVNEGRL